MLDDDTPQRRERAGGVAERQGARAHPIRRDAPRALRNGLGAALGHGDSGADAVLGYVNVAKSE